MTPWRARRGARSLPLTGIGAALLAMVIVELAIPSGYRMIALILIPPATTLLIWAVSLRRPAVPSGAPPEGYGFVAVLTALSCLLMPAFPMLVGVTAPLTVAVLVLALFGRDIVLLVATAGMAAVSAVLWPRPSFWAGDGLAADDWIALAVQSAAGLALVTTALRCRRDEAALSHAVEEPETALAGPG